MNVQEYIASGILEQYVSGLISPQEKQEVECMSHIYPEIKLELDALHQAFELMAMDMSMTPPAHLKASVMRKISDLNAEEEKAPTSFLKLETNNASATDMVETKMENVKSVQMNWLRVAAAILFLISTGLGYLFYSSQNEVSTLSKDLTQIKENLLQNQESMASMHRQIAVMNDAQFQKIELAGIPEKSANSSVSIYWNKSNQEVYISNIKLPIVNEEKQYQLWAIADGKPVDLGMIDQKTSFDSLFQKMKNIQNPQAFAITLEKKGGVPSPTMTEMYVIGKI